MRRILSPLCAILFFQAMTCPSQPPETPDGGEAADAGESVDAGGDAGSLVTAESDGGSDAGVCEAPAYTHPVAPAVSGGCSPQGLWANGPAPLDEVLSHGAFTWDVHRNWKYAQRGGYELQGDLWLPRWLGSAVPGLTVVVHGGGWQDCNRRRRAVDHFIKDLSSRTGSAVWNIEYRLRQEGGGYPENLMDVKCAIQWIVARLQNNPQYKVDPSRLLVVGESAGAHLTAMLALTQGRADLEPQCSDGVGPVPVPRIAAAWAFSGVADLPALAASNSFAKDAPQAYTNGACSASAPVDPRTCGCGSDNRCVDASPLQHACGLPEQTQLFLVHAPRDDAGFEYDWLIPLSQSEALYEAVGAQGASNVQLWIPGAEHLEASGCPSMAHLLKPDAGIPPGGFAHGFQPCLYRPLLPLLDLAMRPMVGPRDGGT